MEESESEIGTGTEDMLSGSGRLAAVQPLKRQKFAVPFRVQQEKKKEARATSQIDGLLDMEKLLKLKSTDFVGGSSGFQAKWTRAIASYLALVVRKKYRPLVASQLAAETHGFAKMWGGRQIQSWARAWMSRRTLLLSLTGHHAKTYSLLSDPGIAVELRTYMRSNKWALDPEKLAAFTKNQLIPAEAEKYAHKIIDNEMPSGLKLYMELELFPRIHLKAKKGISLATARRWLHREGFKYSTHKKGVYFDGHDHPDVVDYRQNVFLPKMQECSHQLVRYSVEDPSYEELTVKPHNFVEQRLVLCAHDEMTVQSHDAAKQYWVFDDEYRLRKKGAGCGIHQSDVICQQWGTLWMQDTLWSMGKIMRDTGMVSSL